MRAGVLRRLAILFASLAATACDLNPRPEDPGGNSLHGVPGGTMGSGGASGGTASGAAGAPPFTGIGTGGSSGEGPPVIIVRDAGEGRPGGDRGADGGASDAGASDAGTDADTDAGR